MASGLAAVGSNATSRGDIGIRFACAVRRNGENATESSLHCNTLLNFTYVKAGKDPVFLSDKRLFAAGHAAVCLVSVS
jgi:hypothetical protein